MAVEDFSDTEVWIESDPNSRIGIAGTNHVDFDAHTGDDNTYFYSDKGSGHFNGDFDHIIDLLIDEYTENFKYAFFYMLSSTIDDYKYHNDNEIDCIAVDVFNSPGGLRIRLRVRIGVSQWSDVYSGLSLDTQYYIRIKRVGNNVYCDVYTSTSDRENEENAVCNLSVTDATSAPSFRYIYACNTWYTGTDTDYTRVDIENLDLQEAGQLYEINVDAVVKASAVHSEQCTFNIEKDASVTSQAVKVSETAFNIIEDAITKVDATVIIQQLKEIFKDAIVNVSAVSKIESIFNISKDAVAVVDVTSQIQSIFNISEDVPIKVLAEVSVVKLEEVKVTKLFLILGGNLAIQLAGD